MSRRHSTAVAGKFEVRAKTGAGQGGKLAWFASRSQQVGRETRVEAKGIVNVDFRSLRDRLYAIDYIPSMPPSASTELSHVLATRIDREMRMLVRAYEHVTPPVSC